MRNKIKNSFNFHPATAETSLTTKKGPLLGAVTELILLLCALALVLFIGVVALIHTLTLITNTLGGYLFSLLLPGAAIIFAAFVPVLSNPIHSLLCLLGLFASTALIYLSQGAEYLALVFLIVYVGALAILFLFVIMLLNVKDIMSAQKNTALLTDPRRMVPVAFGLLFAARTTMEIRGGFEGLYLLSPETAGITTTTLENLKLYVSTDIIALRTLYSTHWPLFALITAILLEAMLGAIVLATTPNEFETKEVETNTPTVTDTKEEISENDNLSVPDVSCLQGSKLPIVALQTRTFLTHQSAAIGSHLPHYAQPPTPDCEARKETRGRLPLTWATAVAAGYFIALLLLTALHLQLLPVVALELHPARIFTSYTGGYRLLPDAGDCPPYPKVEPVSAGFLERAIQMMGWEVFRVCLQNYETFLPYPQEVAANPWANSILQEAALEVSRHPATQSLRMLLDAGVVPSLVYGGLIIILPIYLLGAYLRYRYPQLYTDLEVKKRLDCPEYYEWLLNATLNWFNKELAQSNTAPVLIELQAHYNLEFFTTLASSKTPLQSALVDELLARLNESNAVVYRSVNWSHLAKPFNRVAVDLAEDLGYLAYVPQGFHQEVYGSYATKALTALILCTLLFSLFSALRGLWAAYRTKRTLFRVAPQYPARLYTPFPELTEPFLTTRRFRTEQPSRLTFAPYGPRSPGFIVGTKRALVPSPK